MWKKVMGALAGAGGGAVVGAKAGLVAGAWFGPGGAAVGAGLGALAGAVGFGVSGYEDPSRGAATCAAAVGSAILLPNGGMDGGNPPSA